MINDLNGYCYFQNGECKASGKPYFSPLFWSGNAKIPGKSGGNGPKYEQSELPIYAICKCCPEKVTAEYISARDKKNKVAKKLLRTQNKGH